MKDCLGREWQMGTVQLDFQLPQRFNLSYIDKEGNYKYNHSKDPVEVANGDEVTYTIRIFNEGTIAGYAEEIEIGGLRLPIPN